MVIVDANVLLYAINQSAPNHVAARRWVERVLNEDETVGFAWTVLLAFLRIATLSAVAPNPLTVPDAFDAIDGWLNAPPSTVVHPGPRHSVVLNGLLAAAGTAGNLVGDAHLAALAIEHSARISSFDRDFGRFPGVRCLVPA